MVREMAAALPPQGPAAEDAALGVYATLIGALQLARAAKGTPLSERVLAAGAEAARRLVQARQDEECRVSGEG